MTGNSLQQKSLKSLRPSKRRGGSEIIAALLLVGITVVGAIILTVFVDDNFVAASQNESSDDPKVKFIRLIAYDTRDSIDLLTTGLNNDFDDILRGAGPVSTNTIPNEGGSEFIVMQIENQGVRSVWLHDIFLDGVKHEWDSTTNGIDLDASVSDPLSGKYPEDGKFSVLLPNSDTQKSNELEPGQRVNLVVKLGPNDPNLPLNKGIRVLLNIGASHNIDFVIESGDAK